MELTALSEYTGTAVTSADRSALSVTAQEPRVLRLRGRHGGAVHIDLCRRRDARAVCRGDGDRRRHLHHRLALRQRPDAATGPRLGREGAMSMPGSGPQQHPAEAIRRARPAICPPSGEASRPCPRAPAGSGSLPERPARGRGGRIRPHPPGLRRLDRRHVRCSASRSTARRPWRMRRRRPCALRPCAAPPADGRSIRRRWSSGPGTPPDSTRPSPPRPRRGRPTGRRVSTVSVALSHVYSPVTFLAFGGNLTLSADASMVITR